jgi:nucleoside-diphosphate-sugar epimerase
MNVLITGNLGYIGSAAVKAIRNFFPAAHIAGFDIGYFSKLITVSTISPQAVPDVQHDGDVRNFPEEILKDVDVIIHLAAISNDPLGNKFEKVTSAINFLSTISIASKAKQNGVKKFVFASSCSVYGFADDKPRDENSELNPLTAYAKSKINSEEGLAKLADENFQVTCLRFATACGMSERLRLDLVLNDFVACALSSKQISILSDGTPWRPLINIRDMARAMCWAIDRENYSNDNFIVLNAGSDEWNFQVRELADAVCEKLPDVSVTVNKNAPIDKRSYKVSFEKFRKLAPGHQPLSTLSSSIDELIEGMRNIHFNDADFRNSNFIRLNVINELMKNNFINQYLELQK